jgi:hypothetical protein
LLRGAIGGDLNDPDCTEVSALSACKIYAELSFAIDFVSEAVGNDIVIIPSKPFAGATSYYVLLTTELTASDGQALKGSSAYELVSQSISELPLAAASDLALQALVNSYEGVLVEQGEVDADSIIYSSTFTTQSTESIFNTLKSLQIGGFATALSAGASPAQAAAQLPAIVVDASTSLTAFDALGGVLLSPEQLLELQGVGLDSCSALTAALADPTSPLFATAAATFAQVGAFCAAQLSYGNIELPYYLSTTAPLSDHWNAACTNGLTLKAIGAENIPSLIANGTVSVGPYNTPVPGGFWGAVA